MPQQRWEARVATMKLLCWDAGLPTTERFDCCDRGLYIVCAVAGFFLLFFIHFCHVMATANPATGNEHVLCGVWAIGFRVF